MVQASESDHFMNILRNTKGFVFLGTPHLGSKTSSIAYLLARGMKFQGANTNTLAALKYDNDELRLLQSRWLEITAQQRVINFYEERETPVFSLGKKHRFFYSFVRSDLTTGLVFLR